MVDINHECCGKYKCTAYLNKKSEKDVAPLSKKSDSQNDFGKRYGAVIFNFKIQVIRSVRDAKNVSFSGKRSKNKYSIVVG